MTDAAFDLALDASCALGECPVWSAAERTLYFIDITGCALHRFHLETGDWTTSPTHEEIGCVAIAKGGGFVAGMRSGIWRLGADGAPVTQLAELPEDTTANRFNDGRADPRGRFVLGSVDGLKAGGTAGLYRFDRRGLSQIADGLLTSNGLAFAPDGRTMYHADTPRFTIYAYDYDPETGAAINRRVFATLDADAADRARPDGAAIDAEGCYWTALFDGGRVRRYAPSGEILSEHPVPARCPTMVAFGGDDLKTLYVTSARDGRPDDELAEMPHSGGVFAMRVAVPGLPEPLFDPDR